MADAAAHRLTAPVHLMTSPGFTADPMAGSALYADVERYDSFGVHRYGSPGAEQAMAWIASELERAGLAVSSQRLSLPRQYELESGMLTVDGASLSVVPHWWIPEAKASFSLAAPIAAHGIDPAEGGFVRANLSFDRGAYLNAEHRAAIDAALARRPAAVLLTIDHPSGEIFTYNVDQKEKPWAAPVVLVAPKDGPVLDAAERAGRPVSVSIRGTWRHDVPGRNVVARLQRGSGNRKWIVVSTPVTSWFTSTCERGPGIAGFLAVARLAATRWPHVSFVFVATAGHEIGHGGMEHFLHDGAPPPDATLAWAHFGASLACFEWRRDNGRWVTDRRVDSRQRVILRSQAMDAVVARRFKDVVGQPLVGDRAGLGELRDVMAAGYSRFFGMAGTHLFFHTPVDSAATTGPEILEPVIRAFVETIDDVATADP